MLPRKLYYLTLHLKPRITSMRRSLNPDLNPLISLAKSLAIATLALASIAPNLHAQSAFASENNLTVAEQYLLAAANEARANQGLPPLHLDPVLTEASALHAPEMANHAAISHQFQAAPELPPPPANPPPPSTPIPQHPPPSP